MTDTAWKPTPGRDAMTRDGRRVRKLAQIPCGVWDLRGVIDGEPTYHEWRADGTWALDKVPCPHDLVADWPDADPLPDADGWIKHTPRPVDPEAIVEVRLRSGKVLEGANAKRAIELDWNESGGSATITHYRIVRPAPSGPVVEETVKNPFDLRPTEVLAAFAAEGHPIDIYTAAAIVGWSYRKFEAAMIRARQIGEAMEGK